MCTFLRHTIWNGLNKNGLNKNGVNKNGVNKHDPVFLVTRPCFYFLDLVSLPARIAITGQNL